MHTRRSRFVRLGGSEPKLACIAFLVGKHLLPILLRWLTVFISPGQVLHIVSPCWSGAPGSVRRQQAGRIDSIQLLFLYSPKSPFRSIQQPPFAVT